MFNIRLTAGIVTLAAVLFTTACTSPESETTEARPPETTEATESAPVEADADSAPAVTPEPATSAPDETTTPVSRSGAFASGEHETLGAATLISQEGTQTLTFDEAFATSSGPDLVVVLHRSATVLESTTSPAYPLVEGDYVILAPLATTSGTQQYSIPAEVNVDEYESVAIWCQAFNATFGAAALN
ncbi:MAG: DM13 domain-containing protein [Cyanobacteria bacterium P01_F01_bin.86]